MDDTRRGICVFSPGLRLAITIEAGPDGDEVHLHPGGQGYWVARCIERLGEPVVLCATVGGETGQVLTPLLRSQTGIRLVAVEQSAPSAVSVFDRRSGERELITRTEPAPTDRHAVDKLYSLALAHAIGSRCCVLTGNVDTGVIPSAHYGRLCADLAELGVPVFADLHGPELEQILGSPAVRLVKVSEDDLREDGVVADATDDALADAVVALADRVAHDLVVSRGASRPAAARLDGAWCRVTPPRLAAVDFRGAGDAMVAAMAVAGLRGWSGPELVRFGAAAGAASVSRRGLASLDVELIEALVPHVTVDPVADAVEAIAG